MRAFAVLVLAVLSLACAAPRTADARTVQAELAQALSSGDLIRLAALVGEDPEALGQEVEGASAELSELGRELASATLEESARIHLRSGRAIAMVHEPEGWRIDRGLLGAPLASTPREALAVLRDVLLSIQSARFGVILSRGTRVLFEDELDRLLRGLADADAVPITVEPERATATLPTGIVLELVLEASEWRVEDAHE